MAVETLVLRRGGFSPPLSLLMPTFSFLAAPACITTHLRRNQNAPLPIFSLEISHIFGTILMPDYYPRSIARLVSCYALFK